MKDRSLQDEIEIVSAELANAKNAIGRIMARSDSPAFREGYDFVGAIFENVETSASVLTLTRTPSFSC